MSRTTIEILQDALAHFEIMQTHAEQGLEERLVIDAVCMRLSAGIHAGHPVHGVGTAMSSMHTLRVGSDYALAAW